MPSPKPWMRNQHKSHMIKWDANTLDWVKRLTPLSKIYFPFLKSSVQNHFDEHRHVTIIFIISHLHNRFSLPEIQSTKLCQSISLQGMVQAFQVHSMTSIHMNRTEDDTASNY